MASSPSPPRKKKKRRIRTAATVEAKAAIESQEYVTRDYIVGYFILPAIISGKGRDAYNGYTRTSRNIIRNQDYRLLFFRWKVLVTARVLVPPPPIPPPTDRKRADTLTGDDDEPTDLSGRLRMIPPVSNPTGSMSSFGAINGARLDECRCAAVLIK